MPIPPVRFLSLLLLLSCLAVSGCRHVPASDAPQGEKERVAIGQTVCCRKAEIYPKWAVALVEPAAPAIGRAVALVRWRKGYIGHQPQAIANLERQLRPLDILVVANKGRLSGRLIPGLFSHGAVYVGNEADLRRLGIWNDPAVIPHRQAVRAGRTIIEADHRGVHLSPLSGVLHSDRVVILRPKLKCADARRRAIRDFFAHIGSQFDFHFDSREDGRLYCIELIGHVIGDLELPRRKFYGRQTAMPDEIVQQAAQGKLRLDVVDYVEAGRKGWRRGDRKSLLADIEGQWRK